MNIRQYNTSDLEAVLSSWEAATRLAHPFMTEDFLAQQRKDIAEILKLLILLIGYNRL